MAKARKAFVSPQFIRSVVEDELRKQLRANPYRFLPPPQAITLSLGGLLKDAAEDSRYFPRRHTGPSSASARSASSRGSRKSKHAVRPSGRRSGRGTRTKRKRGTA